MKVEDELKQLAEDKEKAKLERPATAGKQDKQERPKPQQAEKSKRPILRK